MKRVNNSQPAVTDTLYPVDFCSSEVDASISLLSSIIVMARDAWMTSVRALMAATGVDIESSLDKIWWYKSTTSTLSSSWDITCGILSGIAGGSR